MSSVINIYTTYTPNELRSLLMADVRVGDADELHDVCIALCEICDTQAIAIEKLTKRLATLERVITSITTISQLPATSL